MAGEGCWSSTGFTAVQGFILKGEKALMMPVVPRDSASSSHSEDGEVPSTASSDRHSSRDRSIACQILIKRTAEREPQLTLERCQCREAGSPLGSSSAEQALENNQSAGLEDISVLLTAGSPATTARQRRESASRLLHPHGQPPSSCSPAGLWQYPAGHRLPEPILTLSLLPPKPGRLGLETSGRLTCCFSAGEATAEAAAQQGKGGALLPS